MSNPAFISNSTTAASPPRVAAAPIPQEQCGLAHVAELLGDRWTLLILREAFYGVTRFDDLQRDLRAPRAMLSQRLGRLVEQGLLQREPYQDPGGRTRHEYRLTAKGRGLGLSLMALMAYGDMHLRDAPARVGVVDAADGAPLTVSFVRPDGVAVASDRVRLKVLD